jgi:soluble lytic murein transglycosylase
MREGKTAQAYRLATEHHLPPGRDREDLDWIAGYVALTQMSDPARALEHFQAFRAEVDTPISLGRAGYWEGRALEAMGDRPAALAAYAFGGEFQTSFYGQLAAEKAGLAMDPALTGGEDFPDFRQAPFWSSSVMQAARLFQAAGEMYLTKRFALHLTESLDRTGIGQLTDWAHSVGEPHLQVVIAKQAVQQGHTLVGPYFPIPDIGRGNPGVPREWELAITRRESEFNPEVVSPAGAKGLMQLMPGTARDMARRLEIDYSSGRLTSDPPYNVRLGSEYLAVLFEMFGGNAVLISAGYNAGPGRSRQWTEERGHPADATVDVIDWIEHIPFDETQNYVMRVSESLTIYRARLSGRIEALRLSEELKAR